MLRYKRLYEELARELDLWPPAHNPTPTLGVWGSPSSFHSNDPTLLQIGRELGELKAALNSPPPSPPPSSDSEILRGFQEQLEKLREQYDSLKTELHRKEIENLQSEVERLRKELKEKLENSIGLKQIEVQREGLQMIKDIQKSVSRKLDRILEVLIALGRGKPPKVETEIPEYEPVEEYDETKWEEYLPEEFIDEGG